MSEKPLSRQRVGRRVDALVGRIRSALSDPNAPWYGSDLVPLVADLCQAVDDQEFQLATLEALERAVTLRHAKWARDDDEKCAGYRSVALTEFREIRGEQVRQWKAS